MKKSQILLITFLLVNSSFTFSQSGVAKSLEIGNKWVYKVQQYEPWGGGPLDPTFIYLEVVDHEIDNNINIAKFYSTGEFPSVFNRATNIGNRSDSSNIYHYENNLVDFSINTNFGVFFNTNFEYKFINLYHTNPYHPIGSCSEKWTYIKGIGLYYFSGDYSEYAPTTYVELIVCRINGMEYGDVTFLDVKDNETIPTEFNLTQNYPNPFNPTTQISYELPQDSDVELIIYNSLGEEVNRLVNQEQSVGRYTINWNGQNSHGEQVPGGIYFYTLRTKEFTQTKKMLLLR